MWNGGYLLSLCHHNIIVMTTVKLTIMTVEELIKVNSYWAFFPWRLTAILWGKYKFVLIFRWINDALAQADWTDNSQS